MTESELRTYEGEECGHTTEITFLVGEDAPVHAEEPFEQRTLGCPECATTNKFVWTENLDRDDETEMITHNENSDANTGDEEEESLTESDADMAEDVAENEELYEALADEPEACTVVKNDGEECGRELPCQYHTQDDAEA